MGKKNLRRISILVTAQTAYNLRMLADMAQVPEPGMIVDKLVRDRLKLIRPIGEMNMERLTVPDVKIDENTTSRSVIDAGEVKKCAMQFYWHLKKIEDILGDDYDLVRLRQLVEADRDGRCVVLPFPLHSVLLDMSDTCRPDILKDFRISATWTHKGIVFYRPWNIFNQNIEKGYIRLMSESAEAALKGRSQNENY